MKFTTAAQLLTAAITAQTATVFHLGNDKNHNVPKISSDAALAYFSEALGANTDNLSLRLGKDTERVMELMNELDDKSQYEGEKPTLFVSLHGMEFGPQTTFGSKLFSTDDDIVARISQQLCRRSGYEAIELASEFTLLKETSNVDEISNKNELEQSFHILNEVLFKTWEQTKNSVGLQTSRITDKFFIDELSKLHVMQKHEHANSDVILVDSYALELVAKKIGVQSNTFQFAQQVMMDYLNGMTGRFDVYVVVKEECDKNRMAKRSSELNEVFNFNKRAVSSGACFSSEEACQVSTDNCQSHGVCSKTKDCWSCLCSATFNKTTSSTTRWSGADCGKRDISTSANLFLWTTLALLAALVGGVKLLVSVGSQPLPGILERQ